MIFASCRWQKPFGTIVFAEGIFWSGDLSTLKDKRVLVIVHGTANTDAQLHTLAREIETRNGGSFDAFVMFAWPGGATGIAYLYTKLTAIGRAAKFLARVLDEISEEGALTIDIDAHSLGVPIALESLLLTEEAVVNGLWLKAGACGRDLSKYRYEIHDWATSVHVFYSRKDLIVAGLYRLWFGFGGALGAYGERTKGGNIGVQYDVSSEIGGSHVDYRRCNIVVQAMRNEAEARKHWR